MTGRFIERRQVSQKEPFGNRSFASCRKPLRLHQVAAGWAPAGPGNGGFSVEGSRRPRLRAGILFCSRSPDPTKEAKEASSEGISQYSSVTI